MEGQEGDAGLGVRHAICALQAAMQIRTVLSVYSYLEFLWGYRPVLGEVRPEGQDCGPGLGHALGALQSAMQIQAMVSVYSSWISLFLQEKRASPSPIALPPRPAWISLCCLHGHV